MKTVDENKTLEQLENSFWQDHDFETSLVEKCYQYRKIPLKDLSVEQVRLLVGQNISLSFLIPKSLELLSKNILAEGDYFPGDLLGNILQIEENYWADNPKQKEELIKALLSNINKIEATNVDNLHRPLLRKINDFLNRN